MNPILSIARYPFGIQLVRGVIHCYSNSNMDATYSFGYYVRRRKALDMTQRELAEVAGCALVTLKKIETDQRRPSMEMAARLADCLAVPAAEREVFLAVARGQQPVDTLAPRPSPTLLPPRDVVPTAATPLIGREAELATLLSLLAAPDTRLVTLAGPGGLGKTRLALAVATTLQQQQPRPFAAGIVFVDLSATGDAPGMVQAVAAALGFEPDTRDPAAPSIFDQLTRYLRPRDSLLVLDNLEQIDGGRRVVDDLLRATPSIKILATSRERLDLAWEHLLTPAGLAYPRDATADPETFPAGRLFLSRARRLRPDFVVAPDDRPALADLCALVDGMPLALELAAAWIDTLSVAEIAAELQNELGLPDDGRAGLPERHRSLRVVWESAWARLTPAEQVAFARLCVFRGGFTRPAAEAVAEATLGLLGRLAGKYLITFDRDAGRYRIHELLRQYGILNLVALAADDETHQRQFDYFLSFVGALAPRIRGPEQAAVLDRLAAERDNLTAVLEWGLAAPARAAGTAQLMADLHWYWRIRSHVAEASAFHDRALVVFDVAANPEAVLAAGQPSPETAAQLLFGAGHFAWMRGNFALARERHTAAITLWQAAGLDDGLEATVARQHLAMSCSGMGDAEAAAPLFDAALTRYRETGATWFETFILPQVAQSRQSQGDPAGAAAATAEHLKLVNRLGDPWLTGLGRLNLGELAGRRGDRAEARRLLAEGLAIQRTTGHTHSVGSALMMLGEIARQEGDEAAATGYFTEALALYEEMGHARYAANAARELESINQKPGAEHEL